MDIEMDNNLVDENKKNEPMNQINNESINEIDEKNEQMNQINNESINEIDKKNEPDISSLTPKNMKEIGGGYIFNGKEQTPEKNLPWEVIDKYGNVVERCATRESCIAHAKKVLGESTRELNWDQVRFLRKVKDNVSGLERYIVLNAMDKFK